MPTTQITFTAFVHKLLTDMQVKADAHNPSKSNSGTLMGRALFWDTVCSFAKKQSDLAWDEMEKADLIDTKQLPQGQHVLAETKEFIVTANMSAPYKTFKVEVLADILAKSKYKVPRPTTNEFVEAAKQPTKGRCTLSILER